MALLLGVTQDTYTKYEGRGASLMPHIPATLRHRSSMRTRPAMRLRGGGVRAAVALERETR
jgi:hypothetical protein